jgi:ribosomal protein L11 methyltransferase
LSKDWIEIAAQVDTEGVEPVSEIFHRYVHGGISIEQDIDSLTEDGGYAINLDSPVTIKGYVPLDPDAEVKIRVIEEALWHLSLLRPVSPLQTRTVDEEEWKDAWKEFFHVHRIGRRVVIKPSWRDYESEPDDAIIHIDPGMAFGTGLHPTTQMCVVELERRVQPGDVLLDVGTGSGILSIAAARLGARRIFGLDIDNIAVDAARSNVTLNGLQEIIHVEQGTLQLPPDVLPDSIRDAARDISDARGGFDVVVANIIAQVIVDLSDSLAAATRPSGIVIASGIIEEKSDLVARSLLAAGLSIVSDVRSNDWVTLVAQRAGG